MSSNKYTTMGLNIIQCSVSNDILSYFYWRHILILFILLYIFTIFVWLWDILLCSEAVHLSQLNICSYELISIHHDYINTAVSSFFTLPLIGYFSVNNVVSLSVSGTTHTHFTDDDDDDDDDDDEALPAVTVCI